MKKTSLNNFNIRIDCDSSYWLYISSSDNEPTNVSYPGYVSIEDTELINKVTSLTDKYIKDINTAVNIHNAKAEKWLKEHQSEQNEEQKDNE